MTKGAMQNVMDICSRAETRDGIVDMDHARDLVHATI